ncbi:Re/Si-specific NAD(P)(+) transhydrogenase subunit alpha [Planctomycetota bacterium]|nr:Re/Si-specific NAD(P)(+) transhydrogenase subunit alpha [Planctomycetota bacterium]
MVSVFIPKETPEGERRVAASIDTVKKMVKKGVSVVIESGAGEGAFISDDMFTDVGATIESSRDKGLKAADIVMQVSVPDDDMPKKMKEGASLIAFLWAFDRLDMVKAFNDRKISVFAMDSIPRTTRAQKDDALSSQANLAGYKAILAAANHLPKICPMLMTAAGTIKPSRFIIIGIGVAGLQAIATAKRLGAIVEATDPRPETAEQAESLGGKFLHVEGVEVKQGTGGYAAEQTDEYKAAQAKMLSEAFANADAIITTALIPYKKAPTTITADHVKSMRPGSVIIDLAAERGGNCELTEPGETVVKEGVTIVGDLNWPSTMATHSSEMYARNVYNVLEDALDKEGNFAWTYEDDIVDGAMICHEGEIHHGRIREAMGLPPLEPEPEEESPAEDETPAEKADEEKPTEESTDSDDGTEAVEENKNESEEEAK